MITLAIISIGYGIYSINQGRPFDDQILLFTMGVFLIGLSFSVDKKEKKK